MIWYDYYVITLYLKRKYQSTPYNTMQLMTFDEVNTRIGQPMEHDIHRGILVFTENESH
jgi:hypothetical protein